MTNMEFDNEWESHKSIKGPTVVITNHDIGTRILQGMIIFWLFGGFALLSVVAACFFVSIFYVTFRSEGEVVHAALGLIFYCAFLLIFYYQVFRTFLRLIMLVWRQTFGAEETDMRCFMWVDRFISRFKWSQPDKQHRAIDYFKAFLLFTIIVVCFGIPLMVVASKFGFWAITNAFCVLLVVGSSSFILSVNILTRFYRFYQFLQSIYKDMYRDLSQHAPPRLRAAYLASYSHDYKSNILNSLLDKMIQFLSACCLVVVFMMPRDPHTASVGRFSQTRLIVMVLVLILVIACRFRRFIWGYILHKPVIEHESSDLEHNLKSQPRANAITSVIRTLESNTYYKGETWSHVLLIFLWRLLVIAYGFSNLLYLDHHPVVTSRNIENTASLFSETRRFTLTTWTMIFCALTMSKDLAFISYFPAPWLRISCLIIFQTLQLVTAILGMYWFSSFTSIGCLLIALAEFSYREARYFYTLGDPLVKLCRMKQRSIRNIYIILVMIFVFSFASLGTGFVRDSGSETSGTFNDNFSANEIFAQNPSSQNHTSGFAAPVCALGFLPTKTGDDLKLIDFAILSQASYEHNITAAKLWTQHSSRLHKWKPFRWNLEINGWREPSSDPLVATVQTWGTRFIEFKHIETGMSIISIRGSQQKEDFLQDAYMWSTAGMLQMSTFFGTLVALWPIESVAYAVQVISSFARFPSMVYSDDVENLVRTVVGSDMFIKPVLSLGKKILYYLGLSPSASIPFGDSSNVILTGHSLGGGLANSVGAKLHVPSIAFSAPGLGYSTLTNGFSLEELNRYALNVVPNHDPVPKVDSQQAGIIINIPCYSKEPLGCHTLKRTISMLLQICEN